MCGPGQLVCCLEGRKLFTMYNCILDCTFPVKTFGLCIGSSSISACTSVLARCGLKFFLLTLILLTPLECSVLVHSGGVNGGHYYAFIRPTLSNQWYVSVLNSRCFLICRLTGDGYCVHNYPHLRR